MSEVTGRTICALGQVTFACTRFEIIEIGCSGIECHSVTRTEGMHIGYVIEDEAGGKRCS